MINNIQSFLERFKHLQPTDAHVKEVCIEAMKEILGFEIKKDEIKVQGETIFLDVHPTLKTEIFIKKKYLLKNISEKLKKGTVKNIV